MRSRRRFALATLLLSACAVHSEKPVELKSAERNFYAESIDAEAKGDFKSAAELLDQGGLLLSAAHVAELHGLSDIALGYYIKGGFYEDAFMLAKKLNRIELAYDLCDRGRLYYRGAEFAEARKDKDKVLEFCEKGHLYYLAAEFAERIRDQIIAIYYYGKAAELAEKEGYLEQAIKLYDKAKRFKEAGSIAERRHEWERANAFYAKIKAK